MNQSYQDFINRPGTIEKLRKEILGAGIVNAETLSDEARDWANILNKPSVFTPAEHDHDDLYYTEQEVDDLISNFVNLRVDDSTIEIDTDTLRVKDAGITYAKIQNVSATNRILGRESAGAGSVEEITPANVLGMLSGKATGAFSWNSQDLEDVPNLPTKTSAAWSKTIGSGGDYATWAAMIADMPGLIAHDVTVTIKTGTTLTERCDIHAKTALCKNVDIDVKAEKYYPENWWDELPTADSATATTLRDTSVFDTNDEYNDCWVLIVDGTGTDNGFVKITDTDGTNGDIVVASWPGTQPDGTSRYLIVGALVDPSGTWYPGLDVDTVLVPLDFEGVGVKDADISGASVKHSHAVRFNMCGFYNSGNQGLYCYNTDVAAYTCAFIKGGKYGVRDVSSLVLDVEYSAFSDNVDYGLEISSTPQAYVIGNFGDGNGTWGTVVKKGANVSISGTECSGSSGNHIYYDGAYEDHITIKESTTPTAFTNYGKIYTKNDNKLYFQDGAGVEHEVAFV